MDCYTGLGCSAGLIGRTQSSTYSFDEHKKTSQIHVLDLGTGLSKSLYNDSSYSEPAWVSETEFFFIKSGDKGCKSLLLADANNPGAT